MSHYQITIPGGVTYQQAREAGERLPVILHSNLVDFASENDWDDLKRVARQIRELRPLFVVEHFSSFRPDGKSKTGVWLPGPGAARRERLRATVERWRDLVGAPVSLENVPITERVEEYFDLLLETRAGTGCRITCDVPHFIISGLAARWDESRVLALAKALGPHQIHIAGLDLSEERVYDGHNHPAHVAASYAKRLFADAAFFTYEQPPALSLAQTLARLDELESAPAGPLPDEIRGRPTYTVQQTNERLTRQTFSRLRALTSVSEKKDFTKVTLGARFPDTALAVLEKYQTFAWPLGSLDESAARITVPQATEICAAFTNFALILQTWWAPATPGFARIEHSIAGTSIPTTLRLGPGGIEIVPDSALEFTPAFDVKTCDGTSIVVKIPLLQDPRSSHDSGRDQVGDSQRDAHLLD